MFLPAAVGSAWMGRGGGGLHNVEVAVPARRNVAGARATTMAAVRAGVRATLSATRPVAAGAWGVQLVGPDCRARGFEQSEPSRPNVLSRAKCPLTGPYSARQSGETSKHSRRHSAAESTPICRSIEWRRTRPTGTVARSLCWWERENKCFGPK